MPVKRPRFFFTRAGCRKQLSCKQFDPKRRAVLPCRLLLFTAQMHLNRHLPVVLACVCLLITGCASGSGGKVAKATPHAPAPVVLPAAIT